jgi:hypothetical protein
LIVWTNIYLPALKHNRAYFVVPRYNMKCMFSFHHITFFALREIRQKRKHCTPETTKVLFSLDWLSFYKLGERWLAKYLQNRLIRLPDLKIGLMVGMTGQQAIFTPFVYMLPYLVWLWVSASTISNGKVNKVLNVTIN